MALEWLYFHRRVIGTPKVDMGEYDTLRKWRKQKGCKSFSWFLNEINPESDVREMPKDVPYLGTEMIVIEFHWAIGREYKHNIILILVSLPECIPIESYANFILQSSYIHSQAHWEIWDLWNASTVYGMTPQEILWGWKIAMVVGIRIGCTFLESNISCLWLMMKLVSVGDQLL